MSVYSELQISSIRREKEVSVTPLKRGWAEISVPAGKIPVKAAGISE